MSDARVAGSRRRRAPGRDRAACRPCRAASAAGVASSVPAPKSMSTVRPPSSRITFCALMSRWTRPRPCTAASAWQRSTPIGVASSRAQRAARAQLVFHRAAVDELHPQADEVARPFHAVDDDDVAVADLGEERALAEHAARERGRVLGRDREELQRDVAAERVPGAIDLGESALADRFEHRRAFPM